MQGRFGFSRLLMRQIRFGMSYHLRFGITGVHSNRDLILCVKMGVYMSSGVHRGS